MNVQTALSNPCIPANLASDDKAKKNYFFIEISNGLYI